MRRLARGGKLLPRIVTLGHVADPARYVADVERLVRHVINQERRARGMGEDGPDYEDDFMTLVVELYVAWDEYDPSRRAEGRPQSFVGFAHARLVQRYRDEIRKREGRHERSNGRLHRETDSLDALRDTDAGPDRLDEAIGRGHRDDPFRCDPALARLLTGRDRPRPRPVGGVGIGEDRGAAGRADRGRKVA